MCLSLGVMAQRSRHGFVEHQQSFADNAEIADRYYTDSSARHVVAVGDLPTSSVGAPQLVLQ